jgi:hypothetical protein
VEVFAVGEVDGLLTSTGGGLPVPNPAHLLFAPPAKL